MGSEHSLGVGGVSLLLYSLCVCGFCLGLPALVCLSGYLLPLSFCLSLDPPHICHNYKLTANLAFHNTEAATVYFPWGTTVPLTTPRGWREDGWVKVRKTRKEPRLLSLGAQAGDHWRLS